MSLMQTVSEQLASTSLSLAIQDNFWVVPTVQSIHILAICVIMTSIAMLDLRLVGVSRRDMGVMQLTEEVLPWTWIAFVVAAITGLLMFASAATRYYENIPFRLKMVLLVLAGLNMAVFHFTAYRVVHDWNHTHPTPTAVRVAGGLSLVFWVSVVFAGRWIGFV